MNTCQSCMKDGVALRWQMKPIAWIYIMIMCYQKTYQ